MQVPLNVISNAECTRRVLKRFTIQPRTLQENRNHSSVSLEAMSNRSKFSKSRWLCFCFIACDIQLQVRAELKASSLVAESRQLNSNSEKKKNGDGWGNERNRFLEGNFCRIPCINTLFAEHRNSCVRVGYGYTGQSLCIHRFHWHRHRIEHCDFGTGDWAHQWRSHQPSCNCWYDGNQKDHAHQRISLHHCSAAWR